MQRMDFTGSTSDSDLAAGAAVYSIQHAKKIVQTFAEVTTSRDVEAFAQGFTEDCVVHYPPFSVATGHDGLKRIMTRLFSGSMEGFVCHKTLRSISGSVLGVVWISEWIDPQSTKRVYQKGVEFWEMRGDRIARWDAATTTWDSR
jgi:hypothetical protein